MPRPFKVYPLRGFIILIEHRSRLDDLIAKPDNTPAELLTANRLQATGSSSDSPRLVCVGQFGIHSSGRLRCSI